MTIRTSQNERTARVTRNLTVRPAKADHVRGGWFGIWFVPTTTTSRKGTVDGESSDDKHKG